MVCLISDFTDNFQLVHNYHEKMWIKDNDSKRLRRTTDYIIVPKNPQQDEKTAFRYTQDGFTVLKRMRETLEKMPVERSDNQKKFHEEFLRATASGFFREKWDELYKKVLDENKWADPKPQAIVVTPRRFGKTYAVAMFVTAYTLVVEHSVQCIFSTGKRVSMMLLDRIWSFMTQVDKDVAKRVITRNCEEIFIKGLSDNDIRKVFSYPSNEKVLPHSLWVFPIAPSGLFISLLSYWLYASLQFKTGGTKCTTPGQR